MDWTQAIDAYCERLGPGFWAEPLNAVSNAAFLLAGLGGWAGARRAGGAGDRVALGFSLLVVVIGAGSFLFHTFANRWSSLADVMPIAVFIYAYFLTALLRLVGVPPLPALLAWVAFIGFSLLADTLFGPLVGSSASYVPALLALLGIGGGMAALGRPAARLVLGAGVVFLLSLTLRTLDMPLCAALPAGTHFLWHILNAATLGLLLLALPRADGRLGRPRPRRRG